MDDDRKSLGNDRVSVDDNRNGLCVKFARAGGDRPSGLPVSAFVGAVAPPSNRRNRAQSCGIVRNRVES